MENKRVGLLLSFLASGALCLSLIYLVLTILERLM